MTKTEMRKGSKKNARATEVADKLHSAAIHLLRRVAREDKSSGEGPARLSALSVLVFGGASTLGQLAAAERVKPPTMSRIVAGLERSGLVEIAADPQDARRLNIRATPRGVRLLQKARQKRIASLAKNLELVEGERLEVVARAVEILNEVMGRWRE
jgi:DNA-binding MarR family transcriptional regulator